MKKYAGLTTGIIAGWFVAAVTLSAADVFLNRSNRLGAAVGIAAAAPVTAFALWFALSKSFRQFALRLNPRTLTMVQSWRILGFIFVLLEARGVLPAIFAWPAGYGDMAVGATATLAALTLANPAHRRQFIGWQLLGIADLVMAVGLGTTARLLSPGGATMAAMTQLPLSLVPTFVVPLLLMLHVICIAQARSWREDAHKIGTGKLQEMTPLRMA